MEKSNQCKIIFFYFPLGKDQSFSLRNSIKYLKEKSKELVTLEREVEEEDILVKNSIENNVSYNSTTATINCNFYLKAYITYRS